MSETYTLPTSRAANTPYAPPIFVQYDSKLSNSQVVGSSRWCRWAEDSHLNTQNL